VTDPYQNIKKSVEASINSPLLIEVQKKHLPNTTPLDILFIPNELCREVYNVNVEEDSSLTNVIIVGAEKGETKKGETINILEAVYSQTQNALKNKLGVDALIKVGIGFATLGLGDFFKECIPDSVTQTLSVVDTGIDMANKKVEEFPGSTISGAVEDKTNTLTEKKAGENNLGNKLFVSKGAEASLKKLAENISEYHTPQKAMEFTYKFIMALSVGAPKLIVINNPYKLDSASFSLLSLCIFSCIAIT